MENGAKEIRRKLQMIQIRGNLCLILVFVMYFLVLKPKPLLNVIHFSCNLALRNFSELQLSSCHYNSYSTACGVGVNSIQMSVLQMN